MQKASSGKTSQKKTTIFFLTTIWSNVDQNIREGKTPGGVPSIARMWTTCLEHGWEVHVFIETRTEKGWKKDILEANKLAKEQAYGNRGKYDTQREMQKEINKIRKGDG